MKDATCLVSRVFGLDFLHKLARIRGSFRCQKVIHHGISSLYRLLIVKIGCVEEFLLKLARDPIHRPVTQFTEGA